ETILAAGRGLRKGVNTSGQDMKPRFDAAVSERNFRTGSISQDFDVLARIDRGRETGGNRTLNRQPIPQEKCRSGVETDASGLVHRRPKPDDGDTQRDFKVVLALVISVG